VFYSNAEKRITGRRGPSEDRLIAGRASKSMREKMQVPKFGLVERGKKEDAGKICRPKQAPSQATLAQHYKKK